jgi:hypothetical protein
MKTISLHAEKFLQFDEKHVLPEVCMTRIVSSFPTQTWLFAILVGVGRVFEPFRLHYY